MKLSELFRIVVDNDATDLYLIPKSPPMMRLKREIISIIDTPLTTFEIQQVVDFLTSDSQKEEFRDTLELNFAYEREGLGRFRVNVFKGHAGVSVVCRIVKTRIPVIDELRLPDVLREIIMLNRGLVLVVGATGSGKSTTLASIIDYRNANATGHILTIEDPLEFLHVHKKSIVSQREVGIDTDTYHSALKNVLRQSPDVISIGEIRDAETMSAAIHFAETGHLLLSTLHAVNIHQAFERIVNFYPSDLREIILPQVAANIRSIVAQRLIPRADGRGLVIAVGVLRDTPRIIDLIAKGEIEEISSEVEKRNIEGIISIDQSIFGLFEQGLIKSEDALRFADRPNNLAIRIRQFENIMKQRDEVDKLREPVRKDDRFINTR
jgi:twitching motility protein PilU